MASEWPREHDPLVMRDSYPCSKPKTWTNTSAGNSDQAKILSILFVLCLSCSPKQTIPEPLLHAHQFVIYELANNK